jgi:hypothetical protein
MKFAAAFLLAAVLLAVRSRAQTPSIEQEVARAQHLVQSSDWKDKAWGAYFAGQLHSDALRDTLIEQFRPAAASRDAPLSTEQFAYLATLFDAAIQADIEVPAQLLEPFEDSWSDPALILLARLRDAASVDSLLRFAGKSAGVRWLAANNLLYERKSQRWFEAMLGQVSIRHTIRVVDPDDKFGEGGGPGFGVSCGAGDRSLPPGFPPIARYGFQIVPQRGSVLLTHGPTPVYYWRFIVPAGKPANLGSCDAHVDPFEAQMGFLAELGDLSRSQAAALFHAETRVLYFTPENFQAQSKIALEAQEQGIRDLLSKAQRKGFRTDGVSLHIVPEILDRRQSTSGPLPALAPRVIKID